MPTDYERAYDDVSGVESPKEPIHAAGIATQDIAAGASVTFSSDLNMDMELHTLVFEDAVAPNVEVTSMKISAIELNAGAGPIAGDVFRRDNQIRLRPAVPIRSTQPLKVTVRNKSSATLVAVGFTIVGQVARSR